MDAKPDEMSEALMRRRHGFAQKHMMPGKGMMNMGGEQESPEQAEMQNKGGAEVAPAGATPEGMHAQAPLAAPGGDAMQITPEMFMEMMGSKNAPGLRGKAMQHAEDMKNKKC